MRAQAYARLRPLWGEYSLKNSIPLKEQAFNAEVLWQCSCGQEWVAPIVARSKNLLTDCSQCKALAYRLKVAQRNPVTAHSEAMASWDFSKNELSPDYYSSQSSLSVWWLCAFCSYSYSTPVVRKTRGDSCPRCSQPSTQEELQAFYARKGLTREWLLNNYVNSSTSLDELWRSGGPSHTLLRKALKAFQLKKSPEAIEVARQRKKEQTHIERYGRYAPHLTLNGKRSAPELAIASILKLAGFEVQENVWHIISPKELDFFLPAHNLAIEYNGLHWHTKDLWLQDIAAGTELSREMQKTKLCEERGIALLHLWEDEWLSQEDKQAFLLGRISSIT